MREIKLWEAVHVYTISNSQDTYTITTHYSSESDTH